MQDKCQCEFRIRMLGDGCRYCQPQEYIDRLHDTMEDMVHVYELSDEDIEDLLRQSIWALGLSTDGVDDEEWHDGVAKFRAIEAKVRGQ